MRCRKADGINHGWGLWSYAQTGGGKRLEGLVSGEHYAMRASWVGQPEGYARQQMGPLRGLGL